MRLTRQALEALSVPPGRPYAIHWDDALPGFGVKLNSGGSRQWVAQFRNLAGETKRITLGRVEALTLDEARREARKALAQVQLGHDPHAAKAEARAKAAITLKSVADDYLAKAEGRLRPRSYAQTARYLRHHWRPLHELPMHKVKLADIARCLDGMVTTNGKTAALRARAALSALYTFAMRRGLVEANPVTASGKPADESKRDHVLNDVEFGAVWRACREDDHGRVMRLLILTGQRRDEVGNMAWSELDLDGGLWTIPAARMKNRRPHVVPLSGAALDILRAIPRRADRDLVFGVRAGGFSGWSKSKREIDGRIAAMGVTVRPWRLHDIRRTVATRMAELGVLPHVVEAVLSHVSGHKAGVAGVYNRASYLPEKRAALDAWADHVTRGTASLGGGDHGEVLHRQCRRAGYVDCAGWWARR